MTAIPDPLIAPDWHNHIATHDEPCRRCHGSGTLRENPTYTSSRRWDPQFDEDRPCPRCMGDGTEPPEDDR